MPQRPTLAKDKGACIELAYNSQRADMPQKGIGSGSQCGYAMTAMLISQEDAPGGLSSASVDYEARIIKDMEPTLDPNGWGAHSRYAHMSRVGSVIEAYADYIAFKTGKAVTLRKYDGTWNEILAMVMAGRAIGFCSQITASGHFVVIVGGEWDEKGLTNLYLHDPYGDGFHGYSSPDGAYVKYPIDWMKARCWGSDGNDKLTYVYTRGA